VQREIEGGLVDRDERLLEREAMAGDGVARERLRRARERSWNVGLMDELMEEWVLYVGVRLHYVGRLLGLRHDRGKTAMLMHPLRELDSFHGGTPSGGGWRETSEEKPGLLFLAGALDVTLMPPRWMDELHDVGEIPQ